MQRSLFALVLPSLLLVAGCCGGYSVVRTTVASRAEMDQGAEEASRGEAYVLHYSRLGEPASSCGSGLQYVEDLFIRLPSLRDGETFTIGDKGVTALYSRQQEGPPSGAKKISGTVQVVGREGEHVNAELDIVIVLPSGDVVELDDEYTFHPNRP